MPSENRRILCVIDHLNSGGAQRQLVKLACGFQQHGHHVEVFAYHSQDFLKPILDRAGITTHLCRKGRRLSLTPVLALRRLIKEQAFDDVLAFLETPVVYAELACVGIPGVCLTVSERNSVMGGRVSAERLVKSMLHVLSNRVVTNTRAHHDWMASRFPFLRDRLVTIWNGVDTEVFHAKKCRIRGGVLQLLGVGRIAKQKDLLTLVHALAECRRKKCLVSVDWAGETDDESYYRDVRAAIDHLELDSAWSWLGVRRDIPTLLHQYDALILPSLWEGMPNVVCEALAAGLPVLASNVSDNARLVQSGTTGFIFDPDNPPSVAKAIQMFAGLDDEKIVGFRREARAFALKELSFEKCLSGYESLLDAGCK